MSERDKCCNECRQWKWPEYTVSSVKTIFDKNFCSKECFTKYFKDRLLDGRDLI